MVGFISVFMCSFNTSSCLGFWACPFQVFWDVYMFFLPDCFRCFTFFFLFGEENHYFGEYMDHLRRTFNEKLRHWSLVEAKRDLGDRMIDMIVTFPDPIGESKSNSTNDCLLTRILYTWIYPPTRMTVTDPKYYSTFPTLLLDSTMCWGSLSTP